MCLVFVVLFGSSAWQRCLEGPVQEFDQLHIWVWRLSTLQRTCGPPKLSSKGFFFPIAVLSVLRKAWVMFVCPGLPRHYRHTNGSWLSKKNSVGWQIRKPSGTVQRCPTDICQCQSIHAQQALQGRRVMNRKMLTTVERWGHSQFKVYSYAFPFILDLQYDIAALCLLWGANQNDRIWL